MEQTWILPLDSDAATLARVGGKGANLARLVRAGFPVPGGFLVTTAAYQAYVAANGLEDSILGIAREVQPNDPAALEAASAAIRAHFAAGMLPPALAAALTTAYRPLAEAPVAVRSSATAEDLPDMSFAGQQDTYLHIVGEAALRRAIVNCWSSLWTARALGYRARNGIPPEGVALAVVVQAMVPSEASGVLFTANPLNGKRTEVVIDATLGLGEALVSGQVEPDHYVVAADGQILSKTLGAKALAIHGQAGGGTVTVPTDAATQQALPDAAIHELAALGRRVAAHYDAPQDIEWGWTGGRLFLLQARPITSLFPVPAGVGADPLQIYLSFASIQGVFDPYTPLGQDAPRLVVCGAGRVGGLDLTMDTQQMFCVAGERLFINLTPIVHHPVTRRILRTVMGFLDPGARPAFEKLLEDPRLAAAGPVLRPTTMRRLARGLVPVLGGVLLNWMRPLPRYHYLRRHAEARLAAMSERAAAAQTPLERVDFYEQSLLQAMSILKPSVLPGIVSGIAAMGIVQRLARTLPDGAALGLELMRGLPHNVTTEMDLALWQTAQTIRADREAAARMQAATPAALAADYLAGRLPTVAQQALATFLRRYGMRGVGEIDFGRRRWREDPTPIMQVMQSYLGIADPAQAPDVQFRRGAAAAERALDRLAAELRTTPRGFAKARLARFFGRRMRIFAGMRESPKFALIRLFGMARAGLLAMGQDLVVAGTLAAPDDVVYLHLDELRALAAGEASDWRGLVAARRATYAREQGRRQLPRLLLSDGQAFYEGLGAGAAAGADLVGSPVSPGVVEGVVHVVHDPHGAQLAPGEILVCPATDPGWTPLFLAAGGLVMEVGGLMTHGSVVAREYGIPAVVGVHDATTRLQTGQRVRVDGSSGQIQILAPAPPTAPAAPTLAEVQA